MSIDKRKICLLFIIAVVTLLGALGLSACANEPATDPPDITDIYVRGVETEYDGLEHGISIENLAATDIVYYRRSDGTWQTDNIAYTAPGEYRIEFKVERKGYKDYIGSATVKITSATLGGIACSPHTVIYDGEKHGIQIRGVLPSDIINYSADGEVFATEPILFCEIGEYEVFFHVARGYAEYSGSGMVVVLPDIRGEYVSITGVIVLTDGSAIIDDEEFAMTYDVDGRGAIAGRDFIVDGGILTLDGCEYVKRQDGRRTFEIEINGDILYVIGGTSIALDVTFDDGIGIVVVDGHEIARYDGYNYCESADTVALSAEITAAHTSLVFSSRAEQQIAEDIIYIVYDGNAHGYETDYDGTVMYFVDGEYTTVSPEFDSIGRHETVALYKKDGYLPTELAVVLEIVPCIYGMYCNDDTFVIISESSAQINGNDAVCELTDGRWTIDGQLYGVYDGILKNEITGEEFSAAEYIFAVGIADEFVVMTTVPQQIFITVSDGTVEVVGADGTEIAFGNISGEVDVTINGNISVGVKDGETTSYVLGVAELSGAAVVVLISPSGRDHE